MRSTGFLVGVVFERILKEGIAGYLEILSSYLPGKPRGKRCDHAPVNISTEYLQKTKHMLCTFNCEFLVITGRSGRQTHTESARKLGNGQNFSKIK
jgi:hypothetical protein